VISNLVVRSAERGRDCALSVVSAVSDKANEPLILIAADVMIGCCQRRVLWRPTIYRQYSDNNLVHKNDL
jgi:hypothetical protein